MPNRKHTTTAGELEKEIESLANYIMEAKLQIAAISLASEGTGNQKNTTAQMELAEVVRHTEEATNTIMDKTDAILAAAGALGAAGAPISENAFAILEACSFQDITGQRIRKVLKTIEQIELRVGHLVTLFGGQLPDGYQAGEMETGKAKRADEALMSGPQLGKDKPSQDDVDKLFSQS